MNATNLLAANLGTGFIVLGEFPPWKVELDNLAITLTYNGESVICGQVQDALGGSSFSARSICSEASARGYDLTPDLILITGACGEVVRKAEGRYEAHFGTLGSGHLDIK